MIEVILLVEFQLRDIGKYFRVVIVVLSGSLSLIELIDDIEHD